MELQKFKSDTGKNKTVIYFGIGIVAIVTVMATVVFPVWNLFHT